MWDWDSRELLDDDTLAFFETCRLRADLVAVLAAPSEPPPIDLVVDPESWAALHEILHDPPTPAPPLPGEGQKSG